MKTALNGCRKAIGRRRRRMSAAGSALLIALLAGFGAEAMAARPQPGSCWGTCGGDSGPVGGYFTVVQYHRQPPARPVDKVENFAISEACLGKSNGNENEITDVPNMKVDGSTFSFSGFAERTTKSGPVTVNITLNGYFNTPTKATISLKINFDEQPKYPTDNCKKTLHATIQRHG